MHTRKNARLRKLLLKYGAVEEKPDEKSELVRLIADNESGKADARLAAAKSSAINLYHEDYNRAQAAAAKIGGDVALAQALRANDRQALQSRLSPPCGKVAGAFFTSSVRYSR
jgi:hypothetical protein